MFDPLSGSSSPSPFASSSSIEPPPWPTTPHSPDALTPTLGKKSAFSPPTTPSKISSPPYDPYAKEPQIYGQPGEGLISPETARLSNGTKIGKTEPYLRIRITGLDRNRRDILVRFDAQTNLSNFNGPTYRNVSRSYVEFQRFAEQIVYSNPQTIVPALPLSQTSAPTDDEDDRLVKIMLQRWLTRICEDPVIMHDEELRSFVESDFGYQPTVRPRRKTGSAFNILRRGPPDEDEELQSARFELTRLETQFFDAAKAIDKLARARKALSLAHAEMGNKLVSVASTEAHPQLANAIRKFGRAWHSIGDSDLAHASSETVILGDSLGYQGLNSKAAKETLLQRSQVLEEHQTAVKVTITKRRQIERLKASSNIRPEKVDEALEELEEASQIENILTRRVNGISQNLHTALITHSKHAHEDITTTLIEHVRSSLLYERTVRRELEALRNDVKAINQPRTANTVAVSAPASSQSANGGVNGVYQQDGAHPTSPSPLSRPDLAPRINTASPLGGPLDQTYPGDASSSSSSPTLPDGRLPHGPHRVLNGGRPLDGSKSMFIESNRSASSSTLPSSTSSASIHGAPIGDPLSRGAVRSNLGATSGNMMSASASLTMGRSGFIQPVRGKIDQREAARKLANFL